MGKADYWKPGTWNAICDVCGFKFKADQMRERWDGFMVCKDDFEYRHPMDFIRQREDKQDVPWVRREPSTASAAVGVSGSYINGAAINTFTLG